MAYFNYVALDGENTVKKGVVQEIDKDAVARRLLQSGLRPLEIKATHATKTQVSLGSFKRDKVNKDDIDFFTKQVSLLLGAGLSLDASLRVIRQHSHKPSLGRFVGSIERGLKEGMSFSQALAQHPKHFSSMYVNIAKAGEEGGILPAMLTKISEYQATFLELKQFIISSSIYPAFLFLVGSAMVVILLTKILPSFQLLFEGAGRDLPANVQFMMDAADAVRNHLFIFFGVLLGTPALIVYYLKSPAGKETYDRLAIRLPLLSGFVRDLETTRIFRTLEVLVNNGVHLAVALKISSGVAENLEYQRLLQQATEALKEGQLIGPKLKGNGLFPELAVDLLSIGEESGRVGQVCGQVADHFEDGLRQRTKRIMAMVEPLFILFIAMIAGYVVYSMLTVIVSINEISG